MLLSRTKQLEILQSLAEVYPRLLPGTFFSEMSQDDLANLWYLKEQGLIEGGINMSVGQAYLLDSARINAKGMDFLADDGGLSAILGTMTVRLHADTIKELLLARVEVSSVAPEKKSWLRKQLDTASNETIKRIVGTLLDEGVKHAPDLIRIVEQAAKSAA